MARRSADRREHQRRGYALFRLPVSGGTAVGLACQRRAIACGRAVALTGASNVEACAFEG